MKKRITLWLLATFFLANVSLADAQQTGKVPRIGFLDTSTASGSAVLVDAFQQELSKLGWIEGKNITIEYRFAEGKGTETPVRACGGLGSSQSRSDCGHRYAIFVSGQERHYYHPHRDGERWGPRGRRFGCESGAAGRQCHRFLEFIGRAKYQKARDTHGRGPQARPSWTSAAGRRIRPPTRKTSGLRRWH